MEPLRPAISWREREVDWPPPPPGYKRKIMRSREASAFERCTGVMPVHVSQCTYVIDVIDVDEPHQCPLDGPLAAEVREWLAGGGAAARHVAERDYPFGRARILAYAEEMGVPIPLGLGSRMRDLEEFLTIARGMK